MTYDAIIIGAGPGGSTAATALRQAGKSVLILEKEKFPRFHVGESLIPYVNDELRATGAWEKIEQAGFMPKLGAEFVLGDSTVNTQVVFGRHLDCRHAQTFQVERSRFDHLLLQHAEEAGVECWQETSVRRVEITASGASVTCQKAGETIELTSRWLLDASGRDALLGKQLGLPKTDLGMEKKFATFAHFHGVKRNPAPTDGNITVVRLDIGWFWIIPLDAEKTSVGLVQRLDTFKASGLSPEESFEKTIRTAPELIARLSQATRVSDYYFAGDYTYRYLQNAGPRWMLVGDAAGFIDPIFSSGVMLAVKSGFLAAQEILAADAKGEALSPAAQERYTRKVGEMCKVFLNMIRMFYDNDSFAVFMSPAPPVLERALNNLVAGNTDLGWNLRWRVWIFYAICAIQKRFRLVPSLNWASSSSAA